MRLPKRCVSVALVPHPCQYLVWLFCSNFRNTVSHELFHVSIRNRVQGQLRRILCLESQPGRNLGVGRAVFSSEVCLQEDHFQAYPGCGKNSVSCKHLTEDFSFSLAVSRAPLLPQRHPPVPATWGYPRGSLASSKPARQREPDSSQTDAKVLCGCNLAHLAVCVVVGWLEEVPGLPTLEGVNSRTGEGSHGGHFSSVSTTNVSVDQSSY